MTDRTCRCCGKAFQHPAPGALSTKRNCGECCQLPEPLREVLERHQTELTRLRREVDRLRAAHPPEPAA
ncbi:MAG: hypothetical protein IT204_02500 [Fimbriimonadaceae bacterium]|nr:hypothetical protein [Fimbriimonadaceae bacterium]